MNNDRYLITGCNDRELRVWEITFLDKNIELTTAIGTLDINEEDEKSVDTDIKYPIKCERVESILRTANNRVVSLEVDSTCKVLGCHGAGNSIELFYLLSDDKVKDRFAKRLKKERRKAQK